MASGKAQWGMGEDREGWNWAGGEDQAWYGVGPVGSSIAGSSTLTSGWVVWQGTAQAYNVIIASRHSRSPIGKTGSAGFQHPEGLKRPSQGGCTWLPQISGDPLGTTLLLLCFKKKAEVEEEGSPQSRVVMRRGATKGGWERFCCSSPHGCIWPSTPLLMQRYFGYSLWCINSNWNVWQCEVMWPELALGCHLCKYISQGVFRL